MTGRRQGLTLAVLAFTFLALLRGTAHAQDVPPTGLDVLFLVDQSGSMGGAAFGEPSRQASDPGGLRFESVRFALYALSTVRQNGILDIPVRMAVVNFGDETEVALDWTEIAPNPADPAWQSIQAALSEQLSADAFLTRMGSEANLGYTSFLAAYREAEALFAALPPDSTRLRVTIILTDGEPCVISGADAFDCEDAAAKSQHMAEVLDLTGTIFPNTTDRLYAVALDAEGSLWEAQRADWEQVVREPDNAIRATDSQQIGLIFQDILLDIVRVSRPGEADISVQPLQPGVNTVDVPPYQNQLQITLFKASTQPGTLTIRQPDGTFLTAGSAALTITGDDRPIEIQTITDPVPGLWELTLDASRERLDALLQLIPLDFAVSLPPGNYAIFDTATFVLTLTRRDNRPLPAYPPPYTLQVTGTLHLPDSTTQTLAFTLQPDGTYQAQTQLNVPGEYHLDIAAQTQYSDGSPYELYRQPDALIFQAGDVILRADELPSGTYYAGSTFETTIRVEDAAGQPVNPPGLQVEVVLEDDAGNALDTQTEADTDGDGLFNLRVAFESSGGFRLRLRALAGDSAAPVLLGTADSPVFTVAEGVRLLLNIIEPVSGAVLYDTDGFPNFVPVPVKVTFELRDTGGTPVDASTVAAGGTTPLVSLSDGSNPRLVAVSVKTGDIYAAEFMLFGTGSYTAAVELPPLPVGYVLDSQSLTSVSFNVESHPHRLIMTLVLVALGILALLFVISMLVRWRRRRQHPIRGHVYFFRKMGDGPATLLWNRNLAQYNSNTIRIGRGTLNLPRSDPLKAVTFLCDSEWMRQNNEIRVETHGSPSYTTRQTLLPGMYVMAGDPYAAFSQPDAPLLPVYYIRLADPDSLSNPSEGDF